MERKLKLTEAVFSDTGRGLMCTKHIEEQEAVVTVPRQLLVTVKDALKALGLRQKLSSDTAVLALFLLKETQLKEAQAAPSFWQPYLLSVPFEFDTPLSVLAANGGSGERAWMKALPDEIQEALAKQREYFAVDFESAAAAGRAVGVGVTRDRFLWAWFAVNTRCVSYSDPEQPGSQALAPLLDFLNHSDTAQVSAAYNVAEGRYEIRTLRPYRKGEQVFIFYGPHDNGALYVDYGFTIPDNAMNSLCFDRELRHLRVPHDSEGFARVKLKILEDYHLHEKVTSEGKELSWKLRVALAVRTMTQAEYERRQDWQGLVLGEVSSLGPASELRLTNALAAVLQAKEAVEGHYVQGIRQALEACRDGDGVGGNATDVRVLTVFLQILEERFAMVAQLRTLSGL